MDTDRHEFICRKRTQNAQRILDCGGKRSATPLWVAATPRCDSVQPESAAAALCRRTPKGARPSGRFNSRKAVSIGFIPDVDTLALARRSGVNAALPGVLFVPSQSLILQIHRRAQTPAPDAVPFPPARAYASGRKARSTRRRSDTVPRRPVRRHRRDARLRRQNVSTRAASRSRLLWRGTVK